MKKIMFNDKYGLTEAVLAGRKTMTRRIIPLCENDLNFLKVADSGEWLFFSRTCLDGAFPAYKVGEELAVAQRYWDLRNNDAFYEALQRADPSFPLECIRGEKGCHNKMFVRADWMPHSIRITDIKVERLQDISKEDAMKEGVEKWMGGYIVTGIMERHGQNNAWFKSPRDAFFRLFTKLCGYKAWNANPWVYVYTFELVR